MNPPPDAPALSGEFSSILPQFVGVLGGGRMGAGIAHAFLAAGCHVLVVERDDEAVAGARGRVVAAVARSVERGLGGDPGGSGRPGNPGGSGRPGDPGGSGSIGECLPRLSLSTDTTLLAPCELVVEAVPEIWDLKAEALQAVEKHLKPAAVLASNTSSFSITALAERLLRPHNFIGLHFFNPVPSSTLIEVVAGGLTLPSLVEAAQDWVAALGKTAVVVNDSPGFASSRLGVALALEAMRMLEEGVASAADIDAAMVLGYRHHTGPLRTTDLVGLDVRLEIAEYLAATLGDRFAPPRILREKVARGELGRKAGKGFFDWG